MLGAVVGKAEKEEQGREGSHCEASMLMGKRVSP